MRSDEVAPRGAHIPRRPGKDGGKLPPSLPRTKTRDIATTRGRATSTGGKLPPVARPPKTRDIAAKGTGYSGRTLDKVDAVVAVAESEAVPEPVKEPTVAHDLHRRDDHAAPQRRPATETLCAPRSDDEMRAAMMAAGL